MNICFVTPELSPFAKVGGLADVSTALPNALASVGHDVRVILPYYQDLVKVGVTAEPIDKLTDIEIDCGGRSIRCAGYRAKFPGIEKSSAAAESGEISGKGLAKAPELLLVECEELYARSGIYGNAQDEFLRFLLLSRAAIEFCQRLEWAPHILHCNDWQTAIVPLLLKTVYRWDQLFERTKSVLTIHNIGHQGVFPADVITHFGLGDGVAELDQDELNEGRINYLKEGIRHADVLTTVSPNYAAEIQTAEYGVGLSDLLAARRDDLFGILNGIDQQEWNPATDPLIPARYDAQNLFPKLENKRELLAQMGVYVDMHAPTIGIVSRLTHQKGFDLLFDVLPNLLRHREVRLVVLGSGSPKYADFFTMLRRRHPSKVGFYDGFSNEVAHLIEAGSDMFLMPSLYEPCGLNQMYSQAYGTIPIVRKTGGLADTVQQFDPDTGEGTGIVFDHFDAEGLQWALNHALDLYKRTPLWHRLVMNVMSQDHSWDRRAEQYVEVYRKVLNGALA